MREPEGSSAGSVEDGLTSPEVLSAPAPGAPSGTPHGGRFDLMGRSLREHAARGTLINALFLVGTSGLNFVRAFVLAAFLTASDYGVWGILVVTLGTLVWLKQVGIGDKYIQQTEDDQELAFQRAFTLEAMVTGVFTLLLAAAVPLVAFAYGRPELLVPGFVVVAVLPAGIFQTPLWVLYRRMDFFRQRLLQSVEPVVGFVVAVGLAIAGARYYALAVGVLAGAWASAIAAVIYSPYALRLRFDRLTLRSYASFSAPLFVASASGMVIAQLSLFCSTDALGLAGAGAITLATVISQFGDRIDQVVTGTLYPAICAVSDRTELLFETFTKSNRLALMWAMPFGFALTLFAPDLVRYVIGEKWHAAIPVLQAFGAIAAVSHLCFNWDAYFRARNETRPMAIASTLTLLAFLAATLPLVYTHGLNGYAIGCGIQYGVLLACRVFFLSRLFDGFDILRHSLRAIAPTLPAIGLILLVRVLEPQRGVVEVVGELILYVLVNLAIVLLFERRLLREMAGYVRSGANAAAVGT